MNTNKYLENVDWKTFVEYLKNPPYKNYIKNYPNDAELDSMVIWPEIFDTQDLSGRCDAALCADGLTAWGNCYAGFGVHPNFGKVMVMIGERLGISPLAENLSKWADKWLEERKASKHEFEQV